MVREKVVVVGAGVSGLTCAVRLLEAGYAVRVVAAELPTAPPPDRGPGKQPPGMCSKRAAAIWYPYQIDPGDKVGPWGEASLREYRRLEGAPASGVSMETLTVLFRYTPDTAELSRLDVCGREAIEQPELTPGYVAGARLRVPFIDTSVFLPWLEGRVRALGVTLECRDPFSSLDELRALGPVVVNCTGLGARALCGDMSMKPERGQVRYVRTSAPKRWRVALSAGGDPTYVLPRTHDWVLGGTNEPGVWDERADQATLGRIEASCRELYPALGDGYEVLGSAAGLRPWRAGGVRLEAEPLGGGCTVIHNYGHGGAGFTVAWGCAEEVKELVDEQFEPVSTPVSEPG